MEQKEKAMALLCNSMMNWLNSLRHFNNSLRNFIQELVLFIHSVSLCFSEVWKKLNSKVYCTKAQKKHPGSLGAFYQSAINMYQVFST